MDIDITPDNADGLLERKRKWTPDQDSKSSVQVNSGLDGVIPGLNNIAINHEDCGNHKKPRPSNDDGSASFSAQEGLSLSNSKLNLTDLPPEILQHVFSYVDPFSLGRVICVNSIFLKLLHPGKPLPPASDSIRTLSLRNQNDVWASSRRAFLPGFPRPMNPMSELASLQLTWGQSCAFCKKRPEINFNVPKSPLISGPVTEGVRAIWPFHIRSCGQCLEKHLVKELDLLLSKSSALIPGLPFALFSPDLSYITSLSLRQTPKPPDLKLTKYYFRPQVEDLELRSQEVRDLGIAVAEEWYKGLESTGQSFLTEAARFEKLELEGTLSSMPEIFRGKPTPVQSAPQESRSSEKSQSTKPQSPILFGETANRALYSPELPDSSFPPVSLPSMPLTYIAPAPGQAGNLQPSIVQTSDKRTDLPLAIHAPLAPPNLIWQQPKHRAEKTFRDVVQLKADRKAEIERRCQLLDPPVNASTLTYMEAFNAAIQIPMALNDNAWELLKNRIILQRAEAEQKERDSVTSIRASEEQAEFLNKDEYQLQSKQEIGDHTWSEVQKPMRDKIKQYADEYLKAYWSEGRAVSKANSSKFAAEVLHHVKRQFDEAIAQENTTLAAQGLSMPSDPDFMTSRKLKLEDMKWIFEECVKPHTERYTRDLFLCSACDVNNKHFSLDAVIQHYAAKHTHTLSHGNAVVWWKADWPTEPIFDLNPDRPFTRDNDRSVAYSPAYAVSPAYVGSHTFHPSPAFSFAQPYTPFPYNSSPAHVSRPSNWISGIAPGQPNGIYHIQSDELVRQARQVWDETDGIQDLSSNVRLYIIIHFVALGFSRKFTNEPTLSLFLDCVNNKSSLRPLKELQGLQCRTCLLRLTSSLMALEGWNDHRYTLPDLLIHFQKSHIEIDSSSPQTVFGSLVSQLSAGPSRLDWKLDMVQLPELPMIRELMYLPGVDQRKLELFARVFPNIFPEPLPQIEPIPYLPPHDASSEFVRHPRKPASLIRNPFDSIQQRDDPRTNISPMLKLPADDEYDPHRPAPTVPSRRSERSHYHRPLSPTDLHHRSVVSYEPRHHLQPQYSPARTDTVITQPYHGTSYRMNRSPDPIFTDPQIDLGRRSQSQYTSHRAEISVSERPVSPLLSSLVSPARVVRTPRSSSIPRHESLPPIESALSAAERFLNNFDDIASASPRMGTPVAGPSRRLGAENKIGDTYLDPMDDSRSTVSRPRHLILDHPRSTPGSRGPGSRSPHPLQQRRNIPDPLPAVAIRELPPRPDSPGPEVQVNINASDVIKMSPGRDELLEQDRHSRLRPIEYDRNGLPIEFVERRSRHDYDLDDRYYDRSVALERREVRERLPPSPELRRHRVYDRPIRYVEMVDSAGSRYIDERSYVNERYEPVEYVRIASPRGRPHSGNYYVEPPLRSYHEGYVEFDGRYDQDTGGNHDEPIYDRSHPVREDRYEPSEEGERYDRP